MISTLSIKQKFSFLVFITFFMSACGGGGSDAPAPTPPPTPPPVMPPPPVNQAPNADAGQTQSVNEQTTVTLAVTATDSDGTISSIAWSQTSGIDVVLSSTTTESVTFSAPDVTSNETLTFEVTVTDDDNATATASVEINVLKVNQIPIASITGSPGTVLVGQSVSLNGSLSSDGDNDPLTYAWSITVPTGSAVILDDSNDITLGFTPDIQGRYEIALVVNDGTDNSSVDVVDVMVDPLPNVEVANVNGTVLGFDDNGVSLALDPDSVEINVSLLDVNNEIIATDNPRASFNPSFQNELRFFSVKDALNAKSLIIEVNAYGFTSFHRQVEVTENTIVDAKLTQVAAQVVTASTMQTVSGDTVNGFNVSIADQDNKGSLSVSIPSSLLPNTVTSVSVAAISYDPNSPADAEFFPGEYEDTDGNNLVSVAFNFAQVQTNEGVPIKLAIERHLSNPTTLAGNNIKPLESDIDSIIINRGIPASSCAILSTLGDSNENMAGFQVPVYTLAPSGLWELIGYGTVFDSTSVAIDATKQDFNCLENTYTLEIKVSNAIFASQWWNLDYPLLFDQPITQCARVKVQNTQAEALPNILGFVSDSDGAFSFSSVNFITDANGISEITVTKTAQDDDDTADVYFYGTNDFFSSRVEIDLYETCAQSPLQDVVINRPLLCQVSGKSVFVNNLPVNRSLVYAAADDGINFGYDFTLTNEEGEYLLNLPCNQNTTIFELSAALSNDDRIEDFTLEINVDGILDADEQADDGKLVVANEVRVPIFEPIPVISANIPTNQIVVSATSLPSSFPLTISARITNSTGTADYGNVNIELQESAQSAGAWYFESGTEVVTFVFPETFDAQTPVFQELTITDAMGNQFTFDRQRM